MAVYLGIKEMEWLELVIIVTYGALMGAILAFFLASIALEKALNGWLTPEKTQVIVDSALSYLTKTEEGQKNLYTVGALVASGFGNGVGIQKGSGKFSWNNVIGQIASNFFSSRTAPPGSSPAPEISGPGPDRRPLEQKM